MKKLFLLSIVCLSFSCTSDDDDDAVTPAAPAAPVVTQTTISFQNTTFTAMQIILNGSTQTIAPGGFATFTSAPGSSALMHASTSGKTTNGAQVGLLMEWDNIYTFPATGNLQINMFVPPQYFFLKIVNQSFYNLSDIYVNYGLNGQWYDSISITPSPSFYSIGYYPAYTNSNVYAAWNGNTWYWVNLGLTFTNNQSVTIVKGI